MASISRTSTIMPEMSTTEDNSSLSHRDILPPELLSTIEIKHSNLSDLSYLFQLITSNITITAISSIGIALLYHSLTTVRSGVHDMCFDCTPSPIEPSNPSSLTEQPHSSPAELLQWVELLTPAITPILSKICSFILFPVAPIAFSAVLVFNFDRVTGSKSRSSYELLSDSESETDDDCSVDFSETGYMWVAQRRSSFVVQFDEDSL